MKILIPVDHAVGISGPHRNVVGSLNALGARSDCSVVLVTGRIDPDEPYAAMPSVDIRLGYHPHRPTCWAANLRVLRAAAAGCDLIYVPTNLKSLLYAQTVRIGRPLVAGPNVSHLPIRRADSPGKIELRLLADAWFEASRVRRDHVRKVSGVPEVGYVHHAIDLEKFSPRHRKMGIWERLGIPASALKVLYVGRDNEPRKGVSHLLDAATAIVRAGRTDLHFVLVGKMSDQTVSRAAGMPNVSLLGFRRGAELATLYASSDMSVVPSSWESFGFTALEAMANGLPVIGSRIGAFTEIIDDESGVLVDIVMPGSVFGPNAGQIVAKAVLRLADDPGSRRRLGEGARKRAEQHFSEDRLGSQLVGLFSSCLAPSARKGRA